MTKVSLKESVLPQHRSFSKRVTNDHYLSGRVHKIALSVFAFLSLASMAFVIYSASETSLQSRNLVDPNLVSVGASSLAILRKKGAKEEDSDLIVPFEFSLDSSSRKSVTKRDLCSSEASGTLAPGEINFNGTFLDTSACRNDAGVSLLVGVDSTGKVSYNTYNPDRTFNYSSSLLPQSPGLEATYQQVLSSSYLEGFFEDSYFLIISAYLQKVTDSPSVTYRQQIDFNLINPSTGAPFISSTRSYPNSLGLTAPTQVSMSVSKLPSGDINHLYLVSASSRNVQPLLWTINGYGTVQSIQLDSVQVSNSIIASGINGNNSLGVWRGSGGFYGTTVSSSGAISVAKKLLSTVEVTGLAVTGLEGGNNVVVGIDGSTSNAFFMIFDASWDVVKDYTLVDPCPAGVQSHPTIEPFRDGFLIGLSADGKGYGYRFNGSGVAVDGKFLATPSFNSPREGVFFSRFGSRQISAVTGNNSTLKVSFFDINSAPTASGTLESQIVFPGFSYSKNLSNAWFDPDVPFGDSVTSYFTGLLNGLSFDSNSYILSGIPAQGSQNQTATFIGTDSLGRNSTQPLPFLVYQPPLANASASATILVNNPLQYPISQIFTDPQGWPLTYQAGPLPINAVFNGGILFWTPSLDGNYTVPVAATNPYGITTNSNLKIEVTKTPTQQQPRVSVGEPIPNQLARVAIPFSFGVSPDAFIKADNASLALSASYSSGKALDSWIYFNQTSASFSGKAQSSVSGLHQLKVVANHPSGESASQLFSLTVELNPQPLITKTIPDQIVEAGVPFEFSISNGTFTQPDGTPLTLSATKGDASSLDPWITFDKESGRFNGTADVSNGGEHVYLVTATNESGGKVSESFSISVIVPTPPPSLPPALPPTLNYHVVPPTARRGNPYSLYVGDVFKDSYGRSLKLSSKPPVDWLTFDESTATYTGTPGQSDKALFEVELIASNVDGETKTTFEVRLEGSSSGQLALKIVPEVVSVIGGAIGIYFKRKEIYSTWLITRRFFSNRIAHAVRSSEINMEEMRKPIYQEIPTGVSYSLKLDVSEIAELIGADKVEIRGAQKEIDGKTSCEPPKWIHHVVGMTTIEFSGTPQSSDEGQNTIYLVGIQYGFHKPKESSPYRIDLIVKPASTFKNSHTMSSIDMLSEDSQQQLL